MDLYRYFHPHHNPRLTHTPVRLQEIGELEQAATELKKAIKRAAVRTSHKPVGGIQEEHFNEVVFEDVFVPDELLVGREGDGWAQVTSELAFERSGPERYLSSWILVEEMLRAAGPEPTEARENGLDYDHYVEKQIRPVAEPVLALLGLDFAKVAGTEKQMSLF